MSIVLLLTIITFTYSFEFRNVFKDGSFKYSWIINEMDQTITFTLDVQTKGWISLGISPYGSMSYMDAIMCYIQNDNTAKCTDHFSDNYTMPSLDERIGGKSDIFDVNGKYEDSRSIISFSRKLDTGDDTDFPIEKGKEIILLFALRDEGNPDTQNGTFRKHSRYGADKVILYPNNTINSEL